ncbi:hypothetical protein PSPO01_09548 [Paraphaeosphaeria sporulosa]
MWSRTATLSSSWNMASKTAFSSSDMSKTILKRYHCRTQLQHSIFNRKRTSCSALVQFFRRVSICSLRSDWTQEKVASAVAFSSKCLDVSTTIFYYTLLTSFVSSPRSSLHHARAPGSFHVRLCPQFQTGDTSGHGVKHLHPHNVSVITRVSCVACTCFRGTVWTCLYHGPAYIFRRLAE